MKIPAISAKNNLNAQNFEVFERKCPEAVFKLKLPISFSHDGLSTVVVNILLNINRSNLRTECLRSLIRGI